MSTSPLHVTPWRMRARSASESSKPTPKQKPRLATITGFEQRAGAISGEGKQDRHREIKAVEPDQLGEFREVLDFGVIGRKIPA